MNLLTAASFIVLAAILLASSSLHHIIHLIEYKPTDSEIIIPVADGAVGPESFAFDPNGEGPYTGVSDGRIIKWLANQSTWIDFAFTSPERYNIFPSILKSSSSFIY